MSKPTLDRQAVLRRIPSVDEVLRQEALQEALVSLPRVVVVEAVQVMLDETRSLLAAMMEGGALGEEAVPGAHQVAARAAERAAEEARPGLRMVVNATGVVLHTNLGRAPLAQAVGEHIRKIATHYSNLEFDLATGRRGTRYAPLAKLLKSLTGAEDALVVNNNAAAVLLSLETLAAGREVVVSRGELIEIGGAFRLPDIMAKSGAILKEVGTTNRTHLKDYQRAIGPHTALLLKVHPSNYHVEGFTASVPAAELAALAQEHSIAVMEDLGSGNFIDWRPFGLPHEPTVQEVVASGVDLVTFSGDKLLGGPQAGIILGRSEILGRLKANPLTRALRVDKFTVAGLEATLGLYREPEKVFEAIPALGMLAAPPERLKTRAEALASLLRQQAGPTLQVEVRQEVAQVGGGALPAASLPTWVVALGAEDRSANALEEALRRQPTPVLGRIREEAFLLDTRTLLEGDEALIAEAVARLFKP
jgi:L-seryl-tRNA(Ser) seleniumtransferase